MSAVDLTPLCLFPVARVTIVSCRTKEGERLRLLLICCGTLVAGTAGAAAANEQAFQSPAGNIRCVASDDGLFAVRCDLDVDRQSYTDRPETCEGD